MKKGMGQMAIVLFLLSLFFPAGGVFGQEKAFPTGPINLYVGYPPGGGVSNTALILIEKMKEYLNQPVVINYKPGAASAIAADFVAKSKPDGYTLYYTADLDIVINLILEGSSRKFTMDDFVSLGATVTNVYALVVKSDSPWKTLEEFIDFGRKSPPGTLTIGGSGLSNPSHMAAELLSMKAGTRSTYVPFQGGGPADTALLGGHVSASVGSIGRYIERLKPGGGLRALAVTDRTRHPNYPDVPTLLEKGYDIAITSFNALHAPKGLPNIAKNVLVQAFEKTAKDSKIVSILSKEGYRTTYYTPEEIDKMNKADSIFYQDLFTKAGILKK